ncbi:MAG: glycosyltransferase [Actinomycetales bacterium]|nr:glycosyltransferase [Actinomycetales bacterium]
MDRTLSDTLVVGCNDTARESTGGPAQAGAVDGGAATARLAVVVPAYQEVRTIQRALTRLLVALADSWPQVRVLVVSDGCTDGTASAVSALGDERISCVHYSPNRGKGHAIKTGAGLVDADYIAVIDADLDIDPVSLTWLLAELVASGADVVIGSKIHPQSVVHYPRVRRVLSGGYRLLVRTLFRLRVADTQTGVKVFRADALQAALTHVHVSGFAFDLNLLVALTDQGCAIREAPVKIDYQFTSTVPPTAALSMLRDTLAVAYRRARNGGVGARPQRGRAATHR